METFQLHRELSFQTVDEEYQKLVDFIERNSSNAISFDLSNVKICDSAGLALMLEAKKLSIQKNKKFSYNGVPKKVSKLARFSGIEELFET